MLFLLSNDDGYQAKGINDLVDMLRPTADIVVVAPDSPRSGASLSISAHTPVRNKLIKQEDAHDGLGSLTVWSCSGTPDDCVKMAFEKMLDRDPDLVIGGINHGDNCAVNAHYSGTVGIAIEGAIKHVPSIAFSSGRLSSDADFSSMKPYVLQIVKHVLANGLPYGTFLNVNAGTFDEFKGIRICKMGLGEWKEEWQEAVHPHGWNYFWIAGYYEPNDPNDEDTDTWAFNNGYVAVTPIKLDLTDYDTQKSLKSLEK